MPFIYALAFYMPLEEFLLKWLPVSEQAYLLLRQVPDLAVFTMCVLLASRRMVAGRTSIPYIGRGTDVLLFVFFLWAVIVSVLNPADLAGAAAKIKALLRYVILVYVVLILNPTQSQSKKVLAWIGWAVLLQLITGVFQLVGGLETRDFLAARHVKADIAGMTIAFTGDRFEGVNDLMGTMGNTIGYGMFLLVGLAIWIVSCRRRGIRYWLGVSVFAVFAYLTGSRSVVVSAAILVLAHYWIVLGSKGLARRFFAIGPLVVILALAIPLVISEISATALSNRDFAYIFTADYIQMALNQRLGILVYIVPQLFFTPRTIIGLGPDKSVFVDFAEAQLPGVPQILVSVLPEVIEDVYWVALLVYYGLVGFSLWVLFLLRVGRVIEATRRHALSSTTSNISTIALLLLLISIPLNFFNQAFSVRGFSLYLWLMCGLALASYRRERNNRKRDLKNESNSLS